MNALFYVFMRINQERYMRMFISVISQKGGSGKTTISLHIATQLAMRGHNTLLIDADPQASAMAWLSCRTAAGHAPIENLTLMANANGTITEQLPQLAKSYQFVVIDGPPRGDAITRDVLLASDIVLIPLQLAGFDVWAGDSIAKTIEELKPIQKMAGKAPLDHFYVINKRHPRTNVERVILKSLKSSSIDDVMRTPLLKRDIGARTAFVDSTSQGLTVFETEPSTSKACWEIEAMTNEILIIAEQRQQKRAA